MLTNKSVQQRRERGRAAQAAFRKRQIDTIHAHEEQLRSFDQLLNSVSEIISKLKTTIQVSADHGKNDIPKHTVQELVDRLEHAVQRPPTTKSLKAKRKDNEGIPTNPTELICQETSCGTVSNTSFPEKVVAQGVPNIVEQAMRSISGEGIYAPYITHQEAASPVNHTLSTSSSPTLSLLIPPLEIIPYLSPQPESRPTFAGKLFWATMTLGYRLASGVEQLQIAPRLLLYHLRFQSAVSIAGRIGRALLNESTGVTHQDSAPSFTYRMTQHIVRDLVLEGEDVKEYLDAREVELYFWRRGIDPISFSAQGVEDADWRLGELLQELSRNAVCFGDGPKYLRREVEKVFLGTTGGISIFPCLSF